MVAGRQDAVNPNRTGTKAAAHYEIRVGAGATAIIRLRLSNVAPGAGEPFGRGFEQIIEARRREADAFYRAITPARVGEDAANVMRQALAGMLWSKQYFFFDVDMWLREHGVDPLRPSSRQMRNREWFHMISDHVISMPDKWEYPWFAAWDLAFHTIALSTVDIDFAKQQLDLLLAGVFLHPTGQIPAYEWNFSDVNPPVHGWATIFAYRMEQALRGKTDLDFLKRVFGKLAANFGWWVNRKDRNGRNLFEGGFLGLDNIGVFDRSAPLPTGGYLEQADGTAWVALYAQNMLEIGFELAAHDPTYEQLAVNFAIEFLLIARAMNAIGPDGMWDEEDGFYYDVLRLPDGNATRLKVRSMVGLLPLCAATVVERWQRERVPRLIAGALEMMRRMPELRRVYSCHRTGATRCGRTRHPRAGQREPAAPHPVPNARRERVPQPLRDPGIVALSCRAALCILRTRSGIPGELPPGGVGYRHVRRQLELARADLDAGQCAADPRLTAVLFVLRRQLQDRVPDRLGQLDEPVRGRAAKLPIG